MVVDASCGACLADQLADMACKAGKTAGHNLADGISKLLTSSNKVDCVVLQLFDKTALGGKICEGRLVSSMLSGANE